MTLTAAAIRLMAAKGMSAEDIADIADAMEGPAPQLSKGALRTRKWRESKAQSEAENVTSDATVTDHGDVSHVREGAQVVTPSLPSLRSEEVKTPTEPNGSVAPKGAKRGSKRVPDSWSPSEPTLLILGSEGHTAGDLERALTRMRDHEFKAPRTDWDASFRNWVRTDAERKPKPHERHHPDAKYDARQANLARHERGADLAARLHRDAY